jgi:hypothetical protein
VEGASIGGEVVLVLDQDDSRGLGIQGKIVAHRLPRSRLKDRGTGAVASDLHSTTGVSRPQRRWFPGALLEPLVEPGSSRIESRLGYRTPDLRITSAVSLRVAQADWTVTMCCGSRQISAVASPYRPVAEYKRTRRPSGSVACYRPVSVVSGGRRGNSKIGLPYWHADVTMDRAGRHQEAVPHRRHVRTRCCLI